MPRIRKTYTVATMNLSFPASLFLVIVEGCYRPPVFKNRRFWGREVGANAAVAADLAFRETRNVRAVETARRP